MRPSFPLFLTFLSVGLAFSACSKQSPSSTMVTSGKHEHKAPHGGTPIVLGNEVYHLELVRDAADGKLTAYVLDGELEDFVRVKGATFDVVEKSEGSFRLLVFRAVANPATGETIGDTSQFETQADWLKTTASFDATLTALEIRGTTFAAVAFNFPKGNDKD